MIIENKKENGMKRILSVVLVCLALLGCGEKKITEEMLVGEWECTISNQEAKWENGVFQDFAPPQIDKKLVTYKMYDGMLMKGTGDDINVGDWHTVFISKEKNISIVNSIQYYSSVKWEYISDKQYKVIVNYEVTYSSDLPEWSEGINSRSKSENNCIKIKN